MLNETRSIRLLKEWRTDKHDCPSNCNANSLRYKTPFGAFALTCTRRPVLSASWHVLETWTVRRCGQIWGYGDWDIIVVRVISYSLCGCFPRNRGKVARFSTFERESEYTCNMYCEILAPNFFFPFYAVTKKKEKLYNFSRLNYVVGETDTTMINPDTTQ